jgi:hypothetical protein
MAYFAKLGNENIVENVISVNNVVITDANGVEQEQLGVDFINKLYNTKDVWKKTSYNTIGGVHNKGGTPFRKNYAGIGYTYDEGRDAFIAPKPYNSWTLNEESCLWEAPIAFPTITTFGLIGWDENNLRWLCKNDENIEFIWIPSSSSWILKDT